MFLYLWSPLIDPHCTCMGRHKNVTPVGDLHQALVFSIISAQHKGNSCWHLQVGVYPGGQLPPLDQLVNTLLEEGPGDHQPSGEATLSHVEMVSNPGLPPHTAPGQSNSFFFFNYSHLI